MRRVCSGIIVTNGKNLRVQWTEEKEKKNPTEIHVPVDLR